jgi:hypothetical protein
MLRPDIQASFKAICFVVCAAVSRAPRRPRRNRTGWYRERAGAARRTQTYLKEAGRAVKDITFAVGYVIHAGSLFGEEGQFRHYQKISKPPKMQRSILLSCHLLSVLTPPSWLQRPKSIVHSREETLPRSKVEAELRGS